MPFDYEQSIWGRGVASLYHDDPTSFRLQESLRAITSLSSGSKVLEVGCGAGQFIRAIKKLHPEWECTGTDISEQALALATESDKNVEFVKQGLVSLPFEDDKFAAVLVYDVLEHVTDPAGLLKEIKRVLQPGGVLYCFVPCEGDRLSVWKYLRLFARWRPLTEKYAGHINHWSKEEWWQTILGAGYSVQWIRYSEHFFGQLAGVLAFWLIDRNSRKNVSTNNEEYFSKHSSFAAAKKFFNKIIYWESEWLKKVPSPNIHFVCKK